VPPYRLANVLNAFYLYFWYDLVTLQTASFQIALRNFGSWSFLNATTSLF